MPWIALGILVVMYNDEGDHLQAISAQSTTFNARLEWCNEHSAHARVALWGHLWVPKWPKMFFSKIVPRPFGVETSGLRPF